MREEVCMAEGGGTENVDELIVVSLDGTDDVFEIIDKYIKGE